jgi:23S rRNA pseudouridine1911/1915/1917 synthase
VIDEAVPGALAGERLDRVVAIVADVSRAHAASAIGAGGVRVDGETARSGKVRLLEGQRVTIDPSSLPHEVAPAAESGVRFEVRHVDDAVVVIDKPAGLVVHPAPGHPTGTLVNGLLERFPEIAGVGDPMRPGIVHRLDAGSSGLLVVARTAEAAEHLQAQFAAHSTMRRYEAVVWGVPEAAHGIIDAPIGRDPTDPLRRAIVTGGRGARTDYRVLDTYTSPATVSRLECLLETGRTHQIRVHLASIGHPLVGDVLYGPRRPMLGLERPFLHAVELAFDHPTSGERITVSSPLAPDLASWLAEARP